MTDPARCTHPAAEPVDVRDHTTGGTVTVARICRACLTQLPANWGCNDCQWVEVTRLCDYVPQLVPGYPCRAHSADQPPPERPAPLPDPVIPSN